MSGNKPAGTRQSLPFERTVWVVESRFGLVFREARAQQCTRPCFVGFGTVAFVSCEEVEKLRGCHGIGSLKSESSKLGAGAGAGMPGGGIGSLRYSWDICMRGLGCHR